ncbi:MAG TPA: ComEC/Rec2 family competence protein [Candidatus Acidoferrales bacterium]|nr:ComEC/Rec2 family competence protein [Candidatus Acidoferrales bacterium]
MPALWIVAAFAAGVGISSRWPASLRLYVAAAVAGILLSGVLVWRKRASAAWILALLSWVATGAVAIGVERAATPSNHVSTLIAAGRLDTSEPLRWRGRLREDPMALPWGHRYQIDLEEVQTAGGSLPVSGGLRVNLYGEANAAMAPHDLRAGDRVEALLRARPPRNFLDPGAFDLRGYLARQKVDLAGSLRSGELLQLVERPKPTLSQRLARARQSAGPPRRPFPESARARGCVARHAARRPELR